MSMPHLTCTPPVGVCAPPATDACSPHSRPDAPVFHALVTFDEPVQAAHVRALLRDGILAAHPRLRCVPHREAPAASAESWAPDPAFDLDLHVHRRALGVPGDRPALRDLVARVSTAPLHPGRSPWDLVCVDGFRGGGALVARLDRRLVQDPMALVDLLADGLGGRREPADLCPAAAAQPGRRRRR